MTKPFQARLGALALLLSAIGLGVGFGGRSCGLSPRPTGTSGVDSVGEATGSDSSQEKSSAAVTPPGGIDPSAGGGGAPSPASDELKVPTQEQVRAEVKQNPHVTPPSLAAFARGLAPRMTEALNSNDPQVVKKMAFFLRACALSDSPQSVAQVQAHCLRNLQRLAEQKQALIPGLSAEWDETLQKAADEPKRILMSIERIQEGGIR